MAKDHVEVGLGPVSPTSDSSGTTAERLRFALSSAGFHARSERPLARGDDALGYSDSRRREQAQPDIRIVRRPFVTDPELSSPETRPAQIADKAPAMIVMTSPNTLRNVSREDVDVAGEDASHANRSSSLYAAA